MVIRLCKCAIGNVCKKTTPKMIECSLVCDCRCSALSIPLGASMDEAADGTPLDLLDSTSPPLREAGVWTPSNHSATLARWSGDLEAAGTRLRRVGAGGAGGGEGEEVVVGPPSTTSWSASSETDSSSEGVSAPCGDLPPPEEFSVWRHRHTTQL
jgi:hypothetical protein